MAFVNDLYSDKEKQPSLSPGDSIRKYTDGPWAQVNRVQKVVPTVADVGTEELPHIKQGGGSSPRYREFPSGFVKPSPQDPFALARAGSVRKVATDPVSEHVSHTDEDIADPPTTTDESTGEFLEENNILNVEYAHLIEERLINQGDAMQIFVSRIRKYIRDKYDREMTSDEIKAATTFFTKKHDQNLDNASQGGIADILDTPLTRETINDTIKRISGDGTIDGFLKFLRDPKNNTATAKTMLAMILDEQTNYNAFQFEHRQQAMSEFLDALQSLGITLDQSQTKAITNKINNPPKQKSNTLGKLLGSVIMGAGYLFGGPQGKGIASAIGGLFGRAFSPDVSQDEWASIAEGGSGWGINNTGKTSYRPRIGP